MAIENSAMAVIKASRPSFRNAHDKIAFAAHAAFLASGYTLVATGPPAFAEHALSSPPSDEVGIEGWNEFDDSYGFVYVKKDGSLSFTVLVKCLAMGDHLVIDALCSRDQDKEPISVDIKASDFDGGNESGNYADQYKDFGKLVKELNSGILGKIEREPTTGSAAPAAPSRSGTNERAEQTEFNPHDFEPYLPGFREPPILPSHHDDLLPGPGAGIYPRISPDIGGPMLIGPNDPRWFRPAGEQPGFPDFSLGVPPGARYDPVGPPDVPGFGPGRFARNPRRPPGNHPDLEPFGDPDLI
ncbi:hypothetical protein Sjap_013434 [Stephania japonica]|uniref:PI31 proteasome regulator N-terminal domain-containing protein n=1 Tax=Stephania japonica TaxID=461633 RepID=A0AAP0NXM8_9MAGN